MSAIAILRNRRNRRLRGFDVVNVLLASAVLRLIGGRRWEDCVPAADDDLEEASRLARGGPEVDE